MDYLKSYAHQVVSYHPEAQRDELFAELYDSLCEEYEDWQEAHPGQGADAFLADRHDHPMKFATRLAAEESTWLIGPRFYYSFIAALKIGATVTGVVYLVLAAITAWVTGDWWGGLWRVLSNLPFTLLWVSAAILGVFVALEKSGEKASWLDEWTPADLKPMDSHQAISRTEMAFELVFLVLLFLWLTDLIPLPALVRHDGEWLQGFTLSLPWPALFAALTLLLADMAWCVVRLFKGFWSARMRWVAIGFNLAWIGMLVWLFNLEAPYGLQASLPETVEHLMPFLRTGFMVMLGVVTAVLTWETASHLWRLLRST